MASSAIVKTAPATAEDLSTLAKVESLAFSGPLSIMMFGPPSEAGLAFRTADMLKDFSTSPTIHIEKAVLGETGQIVGFALWHFYKEEARPMELWRDKDVEFQHMASKECANEFFGTMSRKRDLHVNGKCYAFLQILVALPEYHGQGIGSALLRQGLTAAEEAGLPVYLESSPRGYRVYRKFGFEDVDEFSIDLEKYGGEGSCKTVCMLRPAGTKLV